MASRRLLENKYQTKGMFLPLDGVPKLEPNAQLVEFLQRYVSDLECHPLFAEFLQDVVLQGQDVEHLAKEVSFWLRDPAIWTYGYMQKLFNELRKYNIWDDILPAPGSQGSGFPVGTIPPKYLPMKYTDKLDFNFDTLLDPQTADIKVDEILLGENEAARAPHVYEEVINPDDEGSDIVVDIEDEDEIEVLIGPKTRERVSARPPPGPEKVRRVWKERVDELLEIAKGISLMQTTEPDGVLPYYVIPPPPTAGGAGAATAGQPDRSGPDWNDPSTFLGHPQPPLARRLETIINFLAEEDVDRFPSWESQLESTIDYLQWLWCHDEAKQIYNAGNLTKAMFNQALNMVIAHLEFEKYHYTPTKLHLTEPDPVPLVSTRLHAFANPRDYPKRNLLSQLTQPRPSSPVNRLMIGQFGGSDTAGSTLQDHLATSQRDERELWRPRTPPSSPQFTDTEKANNLAAIEAETFDKFANTGTNRNWVRGDNVGWVNLTDVHGKIDVVLEDGEVVNPDEAQSWAKVRGAMRAGLQTMLRNFLSDENDSLDSPHKRLVLPPDAYRIKRVVEAADGPQWRPPAISDEEVIPWILREPMPYTISFKGFAEEMNPLRRVAYMEVLRDYASRRINVKLPKNVIIGGPIVWRELAGETQDSKDLLQSCITLREVLRAAYEKTPRDLLHRVVTILENSKAGKLNFSAPEGINLYPQEYATDNRTIRKVNAEELEWLRFLTTECVNLTSWKPLEPSTPKERYRLFHIFANRVKKLLDDKNPHGLFSRWDNVVEVETLLRAINAGVGTSAGHHKVQFDPYEACSHLDRMAATGHVKFDLDQAVYGKVQRPDVNFFPEHRVIWPDQARTNLERPPTVTGYICSWDSILEKGSTLPAINSGSDIHTFFQNLAFRLAWTVDLLSKQPEPKPISRKPLREALDRYRDIITRRADEFEDPAKPKTPYAWTDPRSIVHRIVEAQGQPETSVDWQVDAKAATNLLRSKIIKEVAENLTMIGGACREMAYIGDDGTTGKAEVRDIDWDFAKLSVRGEPERRLYFDVNRWPLEGKYLDDSVRNAVIMDLNVDHKQIYDPKILDPIPISYARPKLHPYVEEKVKRREGPAVFPVGDTKRQREVLERKFTTMVQNAVGINDEPTIWERIASSVNPLNYLPGARRRQERAQRPGPYDMELDERDEELPTVDPQFDPGPSFEPAVDLLSQQYLELVRKKKEEKAAREQAKRDARRARGRHSDSETNSDSEDDRRPKRRRLR
ncbi:hypothetical protein QBC35DRAFT_543455 [Podospora australis]|uniref:Uncharacterized protein n=1 Tax=Podospora australis TaxID=1536484 RepID=A0AAN7ANP9_9PEZI|nr:hypothetical protein QBC35DRAFT_543455 [Podospora australis]